jgi:hypothetical protein
MQKTVLREVLERAADVEDAKLSKASVEYEHPAAKPAQHCGVCRHYRGGSCEIVAGRIRPEDWCKRFKRITNG